MIQTSRPNPLNSRMDPGRTPQSNLVMTPDTDFQVCGPALRILQLNVEGLSQAKRRVIESIAVQHRVDVLCLQETHIAVEEVGRYQIEGFDLLSHTAHAKHGRATYIRSDIAAASSLDSGEFYDLVQVGGYRIVNVYKPPSVHWGSPVLPILAHPAIYVGDFNSHHTDWGYKEQNEDGENLVQWAGNNDIILIHDPKQRATFHSARWSQDYSPDLCWSTTANCCAPLVSTEVLENFPHSQHRPTLVHLGLRLPIIKSSERKRWNFRKADWCTFTACLEKSIVTIPSRIIPIEEAYKRLSGAFYRAAQASIPRGRRPVYVPCMDAESAELLKQFEQSGDPNIAEHLLESLDAARQARWEDLTSKMDFSRSSRKAWNMLRRLGAAQSPPSVVRAPVTPNQVASHLVRVAKAPLEGRFKRMVHDEWRQARRMQGTVNIAPVTVTELRGALDHVKAGTAAGYDNIPPEFLKHLGPNAMNWIAKFLTRVLVERRPPKVWRRSRIIAIPKPGKDPHEASSYRPISLLSVIYKLLERVILQRISTDVENILQVEQAGFRPGRSTCDQVLALTTFIENGFQENMKTGAVFLDLSSAYDTVWHKGLLVKLARSLPLWVALTVELLISDRFFRVHLGDATSTWRRQSNGLPQGSVLAPTLFNIYTNDLPPTKSRKFIYADDICLGAQSDQFSTVEKILSDDVAAVVDFCKKWRLQPNVKKTVSCVFHLHNATAGHKLDIVMDGQHMRCEETPVYLGVTLDRSLTYHEHLRKTAAKVRTRNNIISRLAGSTWGAGARSLRTSALALCYSAAEYCAPVWERSAHVHLVDAQLNAAMRIITGVVRPAAIPWLSVLSNIAPPHIRRTESSMKMLEKIFSKPFLPLHHDLTFHPRRRLLSRRPLWLLDLSQSSSSNFLWRQEWLALDIRNHFLVRDPTIPPPGMDLPRRLWSSLNRYRTDHGRCAADLFKWGQSQSPLCQCGVEQTMHHIVEACPHTRFAGGIRALHNLDSAAETWLGVTGIR